MKVTKEPNHTEHIFIVEDDVELADWMYEYLSAKTYKVTVCHRGDEAVPQIFQHNPDVVILDGMLPGLDGIDVCKMLRPEFKNAIVMVTARDDEFDEVIGLEVGADDYLVKPVRARALLARIRKQLDRLNALNLHTANLNTSTTEHSSHEPNEDKLIFNNLIIDKQARVVSLNNEKIHISSNEFDVLWLLAQQAGEVIPRSELVSQLRGFEYDGFDRSIDLRISRLRKKLGDNSSSPYRIKTIWGKGYLFAKDAW